MKHLSADVSVINLTMGVDLRGVANNHVFVRESYDELLRVIRESQRCVLIGNQCTSKSFFHFFYLARLIRPELYSKLPPDWLGSTAAPSVVIRQMGEEAMTVYDLTARTADRLEGINSRLIACFDPRSTLYLHEPLATVTELLYHGHEVPMLSTVSPGLSTRSS